MKSRNLIFLSLYIPAICLAGAYDFGYTVIEPATKEEIAPVLKEIKANKKIRHVTYLSGDVYVIDIDNDGKKEYVFSDPNGFNFPFVVKRYGKDLKQFPKSNYISIKPDRDGYTEFHNPLTKKRERFIKAQNKIYMCGEDRKVWQLTNGGWEPVCNKFWINNYRQVFNIFYDAKEYTTAFRILLRFHRNFETKLDENTDLWVLNDLLLASIKCNFFKDAEQILGKIKDHTSFAHASPQFINAVKNNQNLLEARFSEKKKGTAGKTNYDILKETTDANVIVREFAHDNEFARTLESRWLDKNIEGKYISMRTYWPYFDHYFFICDVDSKVSALMYFDPGLYTQGIQIYSYSLSRNEMPSKFLETFYKTYKNCHYGCTWLDEKTWNDHRNWLKERNLKVDYRLVDWTDIEFVFHDKDDKCYRAKLGSKNPYTLVYKD